MCDSEELDALRQRLRALEAGLRGAIAYDGHVFNCPAKLESAASRDCSPQCQAARAALDGEG